MSKVYLLYKTIRTERFSWSLPSPEIVDVYGCKEDADDAERKKNAYPELGRKYDYAVKAKKLK
ncbi:hypothetical protein [Serratia proteamaculans]|uniref:hypothetical protein n=1 Tax=Serratia proteamaculans TaxID=28151 RepID=UPI00101F6F3D|nr:hypothetical protein [Serratia proteamaculans]RYM47575.1 hypothetical protein BSQ97_24585 [Serratia proteamaculans]